MNTHELKKKASDYVKREKFEKAIQIYKALLNRSPNDTSLMLKLGKIHQTIGQEHAAAKIYARAAEFFYEKEMFHQGIAVCRLILNANPLDILAQKRLVDMYIKLYGGLPKKRGDTLIPPQFIRQYNSTIPPTHAAADDERDTASSSRDSWQPVDIVFSDADVETGESYGADVSSSEPPRPPAAPTDRSITFKQLGAFSVQQLPPIPLLASLEPPQLESLLQHTPVFYVPAEQFILREGETGDSLFIILEGSVNVLKGEAMKPVARLGIGACFGEMALLGPKSRRATVITMEPTIVMEIERSASERLQREFPAVKKNLRRYLRQRLLNNLLMTCSLFVPFSEAHRERLKGCFFLKEFDHDETVIQRDETVNELYLIVDGTAEMFIDLQSGEQELIRVMGMGEIFGEEPLLTDKPSKVTVRTKETLSTLCLPKEKFRELIMLHPKIVSTVSELLGTIPPSSYLTP